MDKSVKELGAILSDTYENAPRGKQVIMVLLFGVRYREEIDRVGLKDVIATSGIPLGYLAEVNKGMNLAEYVVPIQK